MSKLVVIAVGGNSLIRDAKHQSIADQLACARETAVHIAGLVRDGWRVVVTHGNGPQVGFSLLRSEAASEILDPVPLDACGADTQGTIGYLLQQSLANEFARLGSQRSVATVITQVVVDPADPAFQKPSKPIGPFYTEVKARRYQAEKGWDMVEDSGRGYRRVVASPEPREIVELSAIQALLDANLTVIAVGGGGIPVVRGEDGELAGTAAVIDKDLASSLLASKLGADLFIVSTAVEKVSLNYNKPGEVRLDRMTVGEAEAYLAAGQFPPGSMGPKVRAAIRFLKNGGKEVLITRPEALGAAVTGESGTRIVPDLELAAV
ncbi:MAG: carbamate kinase [Actinobacteria bacterium]|nr:carbamate kinase [Actinomycetota bacterium]